MTGVQLVWVSEKLSVFGGDLALRRLQPLLDQEKKERLYKFIDFAIGKPYNDCKYVMVRGMYRRNLQCYQSSFFYSQLVAEALQRCGVLMDSHESMPSTNYYPSDFSVQGFLPLLANFTYSDEIIINQFDASEVYKSPI